MEPVSHLDCCSDVFLIIVNQKNQMLKRDSKPLSTTSTPLFVKKKPILNHNVAFGLGNSSISKKNTSTVVANVANANKKERPSDRLNPKTVRPLGFIKHKT